jgi:hypothetical protein
VGQESCRVPERQSQSPMRERNAGRRSWGDELVVLAFAVDRARARLPVGEGAQGGLQSFDPGRGSDGGGWVWMMDTERQDQGRERGKRRFDECAAARREGGSFEVSRSDEPKEELTDPLRGEHTPERADVTLNSYEEQQQEHEQQQHFGAR